MRDWIRRIRGAVGMGLTWAVGAFLVGAGIELIHNIWPNPLGAMVDIWPAVLAYPAFLGGVAFSVVLGVAGRRRRFDELSIPGFAALGAVGGVLVSLIPVAIAVLGIATPRVPVWQITLVLLGPLTVGGAVAAAGSLALARMSADRDLLAAGEDVAEVGLSRDEVRDLLGDDDGATSGREA